MKLKRIGVFCGSNHGARPAYNAGAIALAEALVERRLGLVYGGASVGLMGTIADAVLDRGGEVIGVIPESLVRLEVAHRNLADLRCVGSMHERKTLMAELSDGFIALPGGFGTLDEFSEMITWSQLGIHDKPCGLLNIESYFDHLLRFLDHCVSERFIRPHDRAAILIAQDPSQLLTEFEQYTPSLNERMTKRTQP